MTDEILSRAEIHQIASQVLDDEADPDDAKKLIEQFRDTFDREDRLPLELLRYVRDSFDAYLSGERRTLDRAFGRSRKSGRPKVEQSVQIEMATEVLRARLKGATHQDALLVTAEKFNRSESIIGVAWVYQQEGLQMLRLERDHDRHPWSATEEVRLTEIFGEKGWFFTPEKSASKSV